MTRGVLGNDPFRRGAAVHPEPSDAAATGTERGAASTSAKMAASGKQGAPAKAGARSNATPGTGDKGSTPAQTKVNAKANSKGKSSSRTGAPGTGASVGVKGAKAPKAKGQARSAGSAKPVASPASAPVEVSQAEGSARTRAGDRTSTSSATARKATGVKAPAVKTPVTKTSKRAAPAPTREQAPAGDAAPSTRAAPLPPKASAARSAKTNATARSDEAGVATGADAPRTGTKSAPTQPSHGIAAPRAPHLVLIDGAPQASPPPSSNDDAPEPLAARTLRALGFARDLAAAGLQAPEFLDGLKVARGLVRGALGGIGTHLGQKVDAYGRDPGLIADLDPLYDLLYTHYFRVTVQGAVHVPTGPVLLVANHAGVMPYDGPVLQQVMLRERPDLVEARWLVEDQIFHAPFFGTLFNRLGALRACPENAQRLLSEDRPVIVFPEGAQGLRKPFSERDQLKRFGRGGFVKVALRSQVPIVPVAVVGAEETSPLLARLPGSIFGLGYVPLTPAGPLPLPARWMVRFGEPIETEGLGPDDANNLPAVQRLAERTRESIQGMRQALLRERSGMYR